MSACNTQRCVCSGGGAQEDAVCTHPLLQSDNTAALRGRGYLGDVDGDLGRADTDAETVDDTSYDEHGDVNRGAADDGADDPGKTEESAYASREYESQWPSMEFPLTR